MNPDPQEKMRQAVLGRRFQRHMKEAVREYFRREMGLDPRLSVGGNPAIGFVKIDAKIEDAMLYEATAQALAEPVVAVGKHSLRVYLDARVVDHVEAH